MVMEQIINLLKYCDLTELKLIQIEIEKRIKTEIEQRLKK